MNQRDEMARLIRLVENAGKPMLEADYPKPYDSTKPGKEVAQITQPKTMNRRAFLQKARDVTGAALNPDALAQMAQLAIGSEPTPASAPEYGDNELDDGQEDSEKYTLMDFLKLDLDSMDNSKIEYKIGDILDVVFPNYGGYGPQSIYGRMLDDVWDALGPDAHDTVHGDDRLNVMDLKLSDEDVESLKQAQAEIKGKLASTKESVLNLSSVVESILEADYPNPYGKNREVPGKEEPGKEVAQTTQPKKMKRRAFMKKAGQYASAAANPDALAHLAQLAPLPKAPEPAPDPAPEPAPELYNITASNVIQRITKELEASPYVTSLGDIPNYLAVHSELDPEYTNAGWNLSASAGKFPGNELIPAQEVEIGAMLELDNWGIGNTSQGSIELNTSRPINYFDEIRNNNPDLNEFWSWLFKQPVSASEDDEAEDFYDEEEPVTWGVDNKGNKTPLYTKHSINIMDLSIEGVDTDVDPDVFHESIELNHIKKLAGVEQ